MKVTIYMYVIIKNFIRRRRLKMKKFSKKLLSVILTLAMVLALIPVFAEPTYAATGYDRGYTGGRYGNSTGKIYAEGVDISAWQGAYFNFNNIKNAGFDYVILRCGTTYGKDTCFETNYKKAKAAGLDVGVYYYSYATTVGGAIQDANNCLNWISGKKFEYPVYFDYEDPSQDYLSQTTALNINLTFLDMIAAKGYLAGMYTGQYKSTTLPMSQICAKYEFWVASYFYDGIHSTRDKLFASRAGMWQYTSTKYVNGVGPLDANVCYKDYPSIVKKYGFNGYSASGSSTSTPEQLPVAQPGCYNACSSSYTSLYPALSSIGVNCSWELHEKIAAENGLYGFTGTVEENTYLLDLLKQGKLKKPTSSTVIPKVEYFAECEDSHTSLYPALESIGIKCDWDLHKKIAVANGIYDFTGTVAQNTELLNLLKEGKLIKPVGTTVSTPTPTPTPEPETKPAPVVNYFPKCGSSFTSLYPALESIGVNCDWELHKKIAALNGIEGFTGTVAQNTQLLNLLKQGKLIMPEGTVVSPVPVTKYYPACANSHTSLYPALASVGVTCDWELQKKIAAANGIEYFVGTVAQNTELLNLLKKGKLIIPDSSTVVPTVYYYPKCGNSYTSLYPALASVGVTCNWELQKKIAAANGVTNFTGTVAQNTQLLNLLKQGKLVKP